MENENKLLLVGCGILKKEVQWLIKKNGWPLSTFFIDSSLHVDFKALQQQLTQALVQHQGRNIIVFYGTCHPLMEKILDQHQLFRTEGQNCIEMLLGNELYTEELCSGAFFLLEDWALRWDHVIGKTFGKNPIVVKSIFQLGHKYLLCLRTPCSGDFTVEATRASEVVELPIRWMDVQLDNLERVLRSAIDRKLKELS